MPRRLPPTAYETLAAARGIEWLGPAVPNAGTKTGWRCGHGHEWQAPYSSLKRGYGCPHCQAEERRLPAAAYETLAAARGFVWLGPAVSRCDLKTTWRCAHSHQWPATYTAIRIGRGCPHCAGKAPKTAADYQALAAERGYEWLGPAVRNVMVKTGWRCGRGHQWQAPYRNLQQGHGCPVCAKRRGRRRKEKQHGEEGCDRMGVFSGNWCQR